MKSLAGNGLFSTVRFVRPWIALVAVGSMAADVSADGDWRGDWDTRVAMGVSALSFDYSENLHGATINQETGTVPGLHLELDTRRGRWQGGLALTYHRGEVGYTGETLIGTPIDTRTDETVLDAAFRLGYRVEHETFLPTTELYAGFGYRRWDRDIASTALASGLDETYRWPYLIGGARFQLAEDGPDLWSLSLEWVRPVDPELDVTFKNGLDDIEVAPAARNGVRMTLRWRRPLSRDFSLAAQLGYAHWRLGASDSARLFSSGIPLAGASVFEPASETNHVDVMFLLQRRL